MSAKGGPITGPFTAFYRGYGVPLDGEDDDERTRKRKRPRTRQARRLRTRRK